MERIRRAMVEVFSAALRQLDDVELTRLHARFLDVGEFWPAVPLIDREMQRRRNSNAGCAIGNDPPSSSPCSGP